MRKSLSHVFGRLGGSLTYCFLLVLRCPVDTVFCMINAVFLRKAFQSIEAGDLTGLWITCAGFGAANFCLFLYNGTMWGKFAVFSARFVGKLKQFLFDTMLQLPFERIEEKTTGAWLTRLNSDVTMTLNLLTGALNLPHLVFATVRIAVTSVILGSISPLLLMAELAILIPHACLRQRWVVHPMERLTKEAQERMEHATVYLESTVECADTIQLYEAEELLLEKYRTSSLLVVKARLCSNVRKTIGEVFQMLLNRGGYLLLFCLGCEMISAGNIDFGTLTEAFQYRSGMLAGTMMWLNSYAEVKKNSVGLKRMEEIYGAENGRETDRRRGRGAA